ncbi:MAG TPA: LamG domain-containing protein [Flavobacterium sp.]|nr:LamG domain-containing protein [Flavobacterium sp.]
MKHYLKLIAAAVVFAIVLNACQKEENQTTENPETLSKSSELTTLLQRAASNETAIDNVIDSTSCFSIDFPYQVATTTTGPLITIDSVDDYQLIEDFYASNPNGNVQIIYPVNVTFSDYTTGTATNDAEFNILRQHCDFLPVDYGVPCFAINYPITLFLYDSNSQLADTFIIHNDMELFTHLLNMTTASLYSIDYPISVVDVNGENVTINNNAQLFAILQAAFTACAPIDPNCPNPEILTDSLVVYIPIANEIQDLTGYSTPTITGNYHFVTDRSGHANGALSFDDEEDNGANIIQTYQSVAGNLMQDNNFTLSVWFNRQNTNPAVMNEQLINSVVTVLSLGNLSTNDGNMGPWMVGGGNGVQDQSWITQNLLGDIGQWHHVVVTYQGSLNLMSLYRDGVLRGSYTTVDTMPSTVVGMSFGNAFKGFMDDIRGYKYALNASQVQTLYNLEGDVNTCMH